MPLLSITPDINEQSADAIKALVRAAILRAASELGQITTMIWRNDDPDPQGVFDEFSTNAAKVLDVMDAYVDFITALATANGETIGDYIDSGNYTPAPLVFTANMDGTVTVT